MRGRGSMVRMSYSGGEVDRETDRPRAPDSAPGMRPQRESGGGNLPPMPPKPPSGGGRNNGNTRRNLLIGAGGVGFALLAKSVLFGGPLAGLTGQEVYWDSGTGLAYTTDAKGEVVPVFEVEGAICYSSSEGTLYCADETPEQVMRNSVPSKASDVYDRVRIVEVDPQG